MNEGSFFNEVNEGKVLQALMFKRIAYFNESALHGAHISSVTCSSETPRFNSVFFFLILG